MSGTVFLGAAEYSVGERDGFVTVTIERTGDLSTAATVNYATNPNTALEGIDYTDTDGSIVMAAGVSTVTVKVAILNDNAGEATERFNFSIVSVDNGTLLFPRTANISILDDENPVTDPAQPPLTTPYTVTTTNVVSNLSNPISMEWMPGSTTKAFVAEKDGMIKFIDMSNGTTQSVVLDIRAQVNANADRGLMDIALHPDLANNPYLYAFYVVDPAGTATGTGGAARDAEGNRYAHLVRYTLDLDGATPTIVPGSATIMLGGAGQSLTDISGNGQLNFTDQTYINNRASDVDPVTGLYKENYIKVDSQSHAGGALAFGPDGNLYVSIGDGAAFDFADPRAISVQSVDSLSGKILRIDPITGLGIADNPFAEANLSTNQSKVWQMGLRNPYTMTFSDDGRLFMSETGWYSWEEINSAGKGANFGWPFYEGGDNGVLAKTPGYQALLGASDFYAKVASGQIVIAPAYRAFSHVNSDPGYQFSAIVGSSDIYTGDKYPVAFQNDYFFTDIVDGEIYAVDINDRTKTQFVADIGDYGPANFVQGPDGYMYLLDLVNGRILRLNITDPSAGQNHAPIVAAPIADTTATAGTPFTVAAAAAFTDSDGDALALSATLSSGGALPAWLTFNPATGVFSGTPGAGVTGTFTIRVTATDPGGLAVTDDFVITVGDGTTPPEVVVNDVAAQNQVLAGTSANDVFKIAGNSSAYGWGLTDDGQGIVIWTQSTTDNTYDVLTGFEKIRFSDKTISLSAILQTGPDYVDVADTNQQLVGKTANDRFIVNGLSTAYTWGPTAANDGIVIWTNSTTDDTYDVLKGFEVIVFNDRLVSLTGGPVGNAPTVANPIADQTIAEEQLLNFTLPANVFADADGDTLTRSATLSSGQALPSWLSFNPTTGVFSGRPDDAQVGTIAVTVTARDSSGLAVSDTFNLTITPFNDAPTVVTPIVDKAAVAGTAFSFAVPANTFADADNPTLTLTARLSSGAALPPWLMFNPANGTFSGTPGAGDIGALTVVVTATDAGGKAVSDTFALSVGSAPPTNVAPTVANLIADQTIVEEQSLAFTLPANTFADANGDVLTRTATLSSGAALPTWLTFNATTGVFSGRPDDAQVGTIALTVTARDPGGLAASDTFNLTITPFNDAPTVATPIADRSTAAGTALSYVLPASTFADVDNPTLTLTARLASGAALPSWLTFNATTRTFSGTPLTGNIGATDIVVTATDAGGKAVSDTFRLTVTGTATEVVHNDNPSVNQNLTGTSTNDVFVIAKTSAGYQWGPTLDGTGIVVWNSTGYDILRGFEAIRFTNKTVNIAAAQAGPVYTDDPDLVQHLTGKTTNDVFVIDALSSAYRWGPTSDARGVVVYTAVTTDSVYDILTGFEKLQFRDATVTLTAGAANAAMSATISGNSSTNKLVAADCDSRMMGNGGNDALYAGFKHDVMSGGVGNDSFVFTRPGQSQAGAALRDRITDFDDAGNDVINLQGVWSGVLSWRGGGAFTGAHQVRINDVAGPNVVVEVNLSGDTRPEMQILLTNTTLASMTKSDFLL